MAMARASRVSASFGDVSVWIGCCAANNSDVNRECTIKKKLLAFDLYQPDQLIGGAFIYLATPKARIDKSSKSYSCEVTGALCRDIAKKVRNHTLGKIVGLDLIGNCQTP
jgi:hypothetical protein